MIGELYPGEFEAMEHNGRMDALEQEQGMTREEAKGNLIHAIRWNDMPKKEALEMAIKALALEIEPLTDTEQRIFFAAMSREEKVCKKVCADGDGIDLVAVCHSIERKVKKALWG